MAAISVPHNEPWVVARWAFRRLAELTSARLTDEADKLVLEEAVTLDGLHFDLLDVGQGRRLALAMEAAADELRIQLLAGDQNDPRDVEFAEALAVLEMQLHDVHE